MTEQKRSSLRVPRAVIDDPDDDKLVALAAAAQADALVSNDHHLLDLESDLVRVIRPSEYVRADH